MVSYKLHLCTKLLDSMQDAIKNPHVYKSTVPKSNDLSHTESKKTFLSNIARGPPCAN